MTQGLLFLRIVTKASPSCSPLLSLAKSYSSPRRNPIVSVDMLLLSPLALIMARITASNQATNHSQAEDLALTTRPITKHRPRPRFGDEAGGAQICALSQYESSPFDGGRGPGHVGDDAVDRGHRVGDARGMPGQDVVGQSASSRPSSHPRRLRGAARSGDRKVRPSP